MDEEYKKLLALAKEAAYKKGFKKGEEFALKAISLLIAMLLIVIVLMGLTISGAL